ncbi:hypothetical protein [Pedobacter antarcticus]|uniref:hypothetical protein n=1 Tax=Pedobacter antarcticus TaxID=34086 RepID=UPI000887280B|nr:hypothetical protein [Pedobacter antarcticus]SDM40968.1 hypothetical protein SAMN04488084_106183 [Pedobacter antarcticus]
MIEIINDQGIMLQPDPETVVPVEVHNPLFNPSNELFQEIIYNAQAGLTESNKVFISHGHRIDADIDVYEQPVTVLYRGAMFFKGIFRYKIVSDKINFELKVNFATVAKKVKNTVVREIMSMDIDQSVQVGDFQDIMLDTCKNPSKYNYSFFPIHNSGWTDPGSGTILYPWMNNWDHAAQKFVDVRGGGENDPRGTTIVPFFKVSYILKAIFKYLKFDLQGDLLNDEDFNSVYLYTRRPLIGRTTLPSLLYLPAELTISDFIKQISDRMKLNFIYNLNNGTVTIESPITALRVDDYVDISKYVERIEELGTSEQKGYTVTLAVDNTDKDQNLKAKDSEIDVFVPLYTLIVGEGESILNMDVSTLKEVESSEGYFYPTANQLTNFSNLNPDEKWPLRLIKFKGMKRLANGKMFPEARAYDLSEDDASWYRFLNESKKGILSAKIPYDVVSRFSPTTKFCFKSENGTDKIAMNVKHSYNLGTSKSSLLSVKIECQTIVTAFKTPFSIQRYLIPEDTSIGSILTKYKFCYQDGSLPAETFKLVVYPAPGSPAVFATTAANSPSDPYGVGGQAGAVILVSGNRPEIANYTYRIYGKVPKFGYTGGRKVLFDKVGDYYTTPGFVSTDGMPILIVF